MIVDSQCHVSPIWYEPVETLLRQMDEHGVAKAVLIQMLGQEDNRYQQDCLNRFPGRFASTVLIDPAQPEAPQLLRRLADEGAAGVRLRPGGRSPGEDPLEIWRSAETSGLAVSCVGNSSAFAAPEFSALIGSLPNLTIVLEHLGGTSQPDGDGAARALRRRVFDLAQYPNVFLKVPGLGELMPRKAPLPFAGSPFDLGAPTVLLDAIACFGPDRLMWGSDFPTVSSREGYGNALQYCRNALAHLSIEDQQLIMGDVARKVFKLC